ncbi:hypothetical protein K7432_010710 [Basidiobolus ranarum]|uniref:NodB homology domain-containing protein n=1 Tax=Basidiobolus ranarum TaxID=34480 RepID=A0ABR2WNE7_9FUNG
MLRSCTFALIFLLAIVSSNNEYAHPIIRCRRPGHIALTFDDGPGPYTSQLLETLSSKGVPVTFFVIGEQLEEKKYAQVLKRAFDEGHEIASHTYSHPNLSELSKSETSKELTKCAGLIEGIIGKNPSYLRCPYGNCDSDTKEHLGSKGYKLIQWNLDTNDWKYAEKDRKPQNLENIQKVLEVSNPETSSYIILMHDIHEGTVNQISAVIDYIRKSGYTLTTVSDCIGDNKPYF